MRASKRSVRRKTGKKAVKAMPAKTTHARQPRSKRLIATPAKRDLIGHGAVLALAIGALTALAGSALYIVDFNRADALTQSGQTAVEIKIEPQQVAVPAVVETDSVVVEIPPAQEKQAAIDPSPVAAPAPVPLPALEPAPAAPQRVEAVVAPAASPQRVEPAVVPAPASAPAPVKKDKIRNASRTPGPTPPSLSEAGTAAFAGANSLIVEARRYLGTNPTGRATLWCGAFLDMVLKRTGRRGGGNLARGYASYGRHIAGPQVGAIVVLGRQGGGHVGIVTGVDSNGNPIVISGNHNRRVAESVYPRSRVIAYVAPDS